ncbi:carbon-nitrogen hydrolase family protein [Thioflexithrix psekupsensis]|uniref:Acyltransferase n=1 Tax=Thioflexithrix psekupsensis TaxID=1570016 RepID=A0A251X5E0_9GAMM|nr:carbon-nitrogen hydrolase family protein [Thioflexithrix psekupsensis]OUD12606.1 acyltransferase [Thioflexithrix psekupsensis]
MTVHRIAAVQMASGAQVAANLQEAQRLIQEAVENGAECVVLPENFAFMGANDHAKLAIQEPFGEGMIQQFLAQTAKQQGIWLIGGTIPLASGDPHRVRAACLAYNPEGICVARYDKIHLFDVDVGSHERYEESQTTDPGQEITVFDTPFGRIGLAICYDLRFPELFRCLLEQGAEIICVPSAFTDITGRAHWELLTRTRAVENLSYLIAADQGGYHVNGRKTYGDSLIVDPWGHVLNRLFQGLGVVTADIDTEHQAQLRQRFPTIHHRKILCQAR